MERRGERRGSNFGETRMGVMDSEGRGWKESKGGDRQMKKEGR